MHTALGHPEIFAIWRNGASPSLVWRSSFWISAGPPRVLYEGGP